MQVKVIKTDWVDREMGIHLGAVGTVVEDNPLTLLVKVEGEEELQLWNKSITKAV